MASYGDLLTVHGLNPEAGASHFIANGFAEGRVRDDFNETQYLANYADLQAAFGADTKAATRDYIASGYAENRTDDMGLV
jgi:hypothetical protein